MADEKFVPGKMDISVQEKTFDGFISMVTKGAILCIVVLIFMALVGA